MNQEILHRIQGKSLDVEELILTNDGQIDLLLRCSMEVLRLEISCRNVSDLNLSGIHYPMWISGLEIRDNAENGWENTARYTLRDYEEDTIFFHCQQLQLIKLD